MRSSIKSSIKIRILAVIFAVSAITSNASANAVFVSGDVSGVWSADSVVVTDSIRVIPGETLTIEPGVDVLFLGYYKFEVTNGATLHAVGTESDSIRFIPFSEGDRSLGLDFISASNESILEYCHISDALTAGVHLNNSDITIRNCLIEQSTAHTGSEGGGGIEILNDSDALIENNIIRDNYSAGFGGGIYSHLSSPIIQNNVITGNLAGYYGSAYGGGIAAVSSNPQIINNTIANNSVHPSGTFTVRPGAGGGIYVSGGSSMLIAGNMISDNLVNAEPQTTSNGGGIYVLNSNPLITNNVITGNEAEGNNGGGIFFYNSDSELINNTIAYNVADESGGGTYFEWSNPTIVNSIIYFNEAVTGDQIYEVSSNASVSYSDIEGSWYGMGNIDVDPMFRDAINGDYHLQDSEDCGDDYYSQCIDAGNPEYTDRLLDCGWGLGTDISDMGGYGGGEFIPTTVDDNEVKTPSEFFIARNYPNPFNASTTISYVLPEASNIKIDIYDALGRKVKTLLDERQTAGQQNIVWNALDNATGMYFYMIQTDNLNETRKMTLLK